MPSTRRVSLFLVAVVLGSMGLVGCSATGDTATGSSKPQEQSTLPAQVDEPAAAPAPVEEPEPIVLPACETANPLAADEGAEFFASQGIDISAETGPTNMDVLTRLAGPSAQQAMSEALEVQACRWPLYIAGNEVTQYSAVVSESTQTVLVQSLRESDFIESQLGQTSLFTYSVQDPASYRMTGATTIQYVFVEGVWLAIFETGKSDYAQSALDALLAANPTLGG